MIGQIIVTFFLNDQTEYTSVSAGVDWTEINVYLVSMAFKTNKLGKTVANPFARLAEIGSLKLIQINIIRYIRYQIYHIRNLNLYFL